MATITRNSPLRSPPCAIQHLYRSQARALSTSRSYGAPQQTPGGGSALRQMPSQQSLASRMKKMKVSEVPTDVGMLPNTYVRPCGNMPSWFSQPKIRSRLEWLYLRQGFIQFLTRWWQNRWTQDKDPMSGRRMKLPLDVRQRYVNARDLHQKLYSAIAKGDRATIKEVACSGLANQQISRLDRIRLNGEVEQQDWTVKYRGWILPSRLYWTLQSLIPSYFRAVHVLADVQATLPVGAGLLVRQVFVRIDSTQTLDKKDGTKPITKDMREYMVIQQRIVDNKPEDWQVWGTTEPTSTDEGIEMIQAGKNENGSLADRVRAMVPGL